MRGPSLSQSESKLSGTGPILDIQVSKTYLGRGNSPFLLQANFQVESGFTVFVGPSGAGKSTLLRCIAGLMDPDEGRIRLADKTLFDSQQKINIAACDRNVAFVFQSLALFPHLTVEENIGYGLRRLEAGERRQRVHQILESFRIAHLPKNFPREISGGERQRVAVARALIVRPALLLLDEPLSSLDVVTKNGIIEDLKKWNEEHEVPILYVTHDQNELFALGEQIIIFDPNGQMAEGLDVVEPENAASRAEHDRHQKNVLDATVVDVQPEVNLVTCRVAHGFEVNVPFRPISLGAEVEIGIDSSRMLIARSEPALMNYASVVRGTTAGLTAVEGGKRTLTVLGPGNRELQIDHYGPAPTPGPVWLLIPPSAIDSVRLKRLRPLQRLVLFVGSSNASLSAMAEIICNAKIAERLRMPRRALASSPVRAMSAGLQATPGAGLNKATAEALKKNGMEDFGHKARAVSPELVMNSSMIFCMTQNQCEDLVRQHPYAAGKTFRLSSEEDLELPDTNSGFEELSKRMEQLVQRRLTTLGF